MKHKPKSKSTDSVLRRRAEMQLSSRQDNEKTGRNETDLAADNQRVLHELQVHQIELEMQNAELQEARERMEILLEKYTDLYDFAPVGYFSLDQDGRILEVNLAGAAMLGTERSQLIQRQLKRFVARSSQPVFLRFLRKVAAGHGNQVCDVMLRKADGLAFFANLNAATALPPGGSPAGCRVTISDITTLKRAEEAQRRIECLGIENQELTLEIVRRQVVEETLERTKQHQSRLLEESHQMQAQLRSLTHRILHAQEEERKRISRELHDDITQILVGINVHLESLSHQASIDPLELKLKIARTQRLVEKSVNVVHQFARELRPTALDDLGLVPALQSFMKDFGKRTGIRLRFAPFSGLEKLSSSRRTVIYRVVHAALTNAAQHAEATEVKVSIRKVNEAIHLEITDNGKSFNAEHELKAKGNKHLGLLGMRERTEMVGGVLTVQSTPGRGTTIRAHIPLRRGSSSAVHAS